MYQLRPAKEDDYNFAFNLFCQVYADQRTKFWQGQERAFEEHFSKNYFDPDRTQIIIHEGKEIGILQLFKIVQQMYIQEIQILPEHQHKGIGTRIVKDIKENAFEKEYSVGVSVKKTNRAKHLFDRLGFIMVDETRTHYILEVETAQPKKKRFGRW